MRPRIRGLTSRERKRPEERAKDSRRDRRRGTPEEGPKEVNFEIVERINEEDDSIPSLNDNDRMLLFSFIKDTVGENHEETQLGATHNTNHIGNARSEPPTQHMTTFPREDHMESETEIGAACFEPSTALLLQDPLNQDTYDPGQALSRPIGSMAYADTVLAERNGFDGRGACFF